MSFDILIVVGDVPPAEGDPHAGQLYGCWVMVQRHWWNGSSTARSRRDVYIRSDGLQWDVLVQIGGAAGRYRVQECPSIGSAMIVAGAWRGGDAAWRELALPPRATAPAPAA